MSANTVRDLLSVRLGIEMTMFRLTARGLIERPRLEPLPLSGKDSSHAKIGRRPIFVDANNGMAASGYLRFQQARTGNVVPGPAVIHTADHDHCAARQATRHDGRLSQCVDRFRCLGREHDRKDRPWIR